MDILFKRQILIRWDLDRTIYSAFLTNFQVMLFYGPHLEEYGARNNPNHLAPNLLSLPDLICQLMIRLEIEGVEAFARLGPEPAPMGVK